MSFIPPLMQEICDHPAVRYRPSKNGKRERYDLCMRVNRLSDEQWHTLSEPAQQWFVAAVAAVKARKDIPNFSGADGATPRAVDPDKSKGTKCRRIVRCMMENPDLTFEEGCSLMFDEYGVQYRNINEIYSKKSLCKIQLEEMDRLGLLSEEGRAVLHGRLFQKSQRRRGPTGRERPRAHDRKEGSDASQD